ncbi:hypothetical protein L6164_013851 [Bauhinia variegata]|uniref:Uncharacterized protein n=1 Tax=Bauhinia variegata TaxID=167791 RepID=A0ACB9NG14_BAUVA|nr:hypothetical protein L6164_013851 [Bauhinia variegata]
MAESYNIGVPWIMCQQPNAPQPMATLPNRKNYREFSSQWRKLSVSSSDYGNSVKVIECPLVLVLSLKLNTSFFTFQTSRLLFMPQKKHRAVSLLPDCVTEVYNTAKVNVQTSIMVKRPNKAEDEPVSLKWAWRSEIVEDALHGKSNVTAYTLLDQRDAANDASDCSHWASYGIHNDKFETSIKLKSCKNVISLLSVTVGLQHLPTNTMFTWYKTAFQAPLGKDPVVVDLQGLGKRLAWVNGHSRGRYWPSYNAVEDGCSDESSDYRGTMFLDPFLKNLNTLVLFEEIGGNPFMGNFQTITVGSACGNAYENKTLELSCPGHPISSIKFASFGNPQGAREHLPREAAKARTMLCPSCKIDVLARKGAPLMFQRRYLGQQIVEIGRGGCLLGLYF